MTFPLGLVVSVALAVPPAAAGPVTTLTYGQMRPGQQFEIATANQVFRGEFIDPATGECRAAMARAGEPWGAPHRLWLLGATQGAHAGSGGLQLTFMHQVRVGMKMELGMGSLNPENRIVTEPVRSITLLASPTAHIQQTALR